tara:strand:- start:36 stop:194 length:159 start_codon:yes stop_codon:yes gene_type:complete
MIAGVIHAQVRWETTGVCSVGDPSVQEKDERSVTYGPNWPTHGLQYGVYRWL